MTVAFEDEPSDWSNAVDVALAWCEAACSRDLTSVIALCDDDVILEWPRGVGKGTEILGPWLRASHVVRPGRVFGRARTVVVEQPREPTEDKEPAGALAFEVEAARLRRIVRFRTLREALEETAMGPGDEIVPARTSMTRALRSA